MAAELWAIGGGGGEFFVSGGGGWCGHGGGWGARGGGGGGAPPLFCWLPGRMAAVVILVIGGLYLVPQFRTAGLVLSAVSGTPYWVGVVVAGTGVAITLALGGMRAATYVQAFQFVLKLVLFIVPAIWLLAT